MPRAAAAARLPAAAHVGGAAGQEQVVHRAEERVGAGERQRRHCRPPRDRPHRARRARAASASAAIRAGCQSGATRPYTRRRATPPSGKMLSRTWLTGAARDRREQVLRRPAAAATAPAARPSRDARSSSASGVPVGAAHAVDRREWRVVAEEMVVSMSKPSTWPGAPSSQHAPVESPSVPARARRRRLSQPSIHLPRSVYLPSMKTPRPGLQQVLHRRRRNRRWQPSARAAQRRRGEIDQAGEADGDWLAHAALRASRPSKGTPRADRAGSMPS